MVTRSRPPAGRAPSAARSGAGNAGAPQSDKAAPGRSKLPSVIATAKTELAELTGRSVGAATAVQREGDHWRLTLEVVELERIPASTNLIGSYDVRVDDEGHLLEYTRTHRYHRNQADDGDGS